MYEHDLTGSDRTLAKKERARKIGWSVTMFLGGLVCAWLSVGALSAPHSNDDIVPEEIRARKFVVVDESGKGRAEFGILEDGQAVMVVWNEKASTAVSVGMDRFGMPRVAFENSKAEALLELGILEDRFPVLILNDANGTRRLGMVVSDTGLASIGLYDKKKRPRCAISVDESGSPQIVMRDGRGQARGSLMVHDKSGAAVSLLDPEGRERALIQVNPEGEPDAALLGPSGEPIWSARGDSSKTFKGGKRASDQADKAGSTRRTESRI